MSTIFLLTGYANAVSSKPNRLGAREGILFGVYLLMAWPLFFNVECAVYHRWTLLWLVIFKVGLCIFDICYISPIVQILLAFTAACPLASIPDNVHSVLPNSALSVNGSSVQAFQDPSLILVNEFFFWSIGHKMYWFALYLIAHHFGPRLTPLLQDRSELLCKLLDRKVKAFMAGTLLFAWLLQRAYSMPYDPELPPATADWPSFFIPFYLYPVNILLDVAQVMLLALTVGIGNPVLRTCGEGVIGTYVTHAYVNLGVFELASKSSLFANLGAVPILGDFLQLAVILAFPITYAITIGRFSKLALLAGFRLAPK